MSLVGVGHCSVVNTIIRSVVNARERDKKRDEKLRAAAKIGGCGEKGVPIRNVTMSWQKSTTPKIMAPKSMNNPQNADVQRRLAFSLLSVF